MLGSHAAKIARTRQSVVDTAFGLFTQHGYDAVTVEAIAEAAMVSPRTVYRYFESKELIALSIMEGENERFVARVREHCRDGVRLHEVIAAVAEQLGDRQHHRWFPELTILLRDNDVLTRRADTWRRSLVADVAAVLAEIEGTDCAFRHEALAVTAVSLGAAAVGRWATDDHEADLGALVWEAGTVVAEEFTSLQP